MRRAIQRHRKEAFGIVSMVVLGALAVGYVLVHQVSFHAPSWVPFLGHSYYAVDAEFSTAQAVVPGQGQTVDVAGVQVGYVSAVRLQNGMAVVTLHLEHKYAPIHRDATLLLRPRTPLKDMYVSLYPGTAQAGTIPDGGVLPVGQTEPDVSFDQVLSSLDADSRDYLQILLAAGSGALRDGATPNGTPSAAAVADLRGTFQRLSPLAADTRRLTEQLALRQRNLRHVITSFGQIATSVGAVDHNISSLVVAANRSFGAVASEDARLGAALSLLPGTLQQTQRSLQQASAFEDQIGPTLAALRPLAQNLGPALRATQPFLRDTTPIIEHQLRPFSTTVRPVVRTLRPGVASLRTTIPSLRSTLGVVNRFFNALAFNPAGRQNSYAFWLGWLSHIGTSIVSLQDANGPLARSVLGATCAQLDALHQVQLGNPQLGPIIDIANLPDRLKVCPGESTLLP